MNFCTIFFDIQNAINVVCKNSIQSLPLTGPAIHQGEKEKEMILLAYSTNASIYIRHINI